MGSLGDVYPVDQEVREEMLDRLDLEHHLLIWMPLLCSRSLRATRREAECRPHGRQRLETLTALCRVWGGIGRKTCYMTRGHGRSVGCGSLEPLAVAVLNPWLWQS